MLLVCICLRPFNSWGRSLWRSTRGIPKEWRGSGDFFFLFTFLGRSRTENTFPTLVLARPKREKYTYLFIYVCIYVYFYLSNKERNKIKVRNNSMKNRIGKREQRVTSQSPSVRRHLYIYSYKYFLENGLNTISFFLIMVSSYNMFYFSY